MTDYSHSRLSKFEQCRFLYKLEYIDGIKIKRKTIEQFLGTSVHESLEVFHKNANHGKIDTIDEVCAYYNNIWDTQWTEDILIVNSSYAKDHYRKRGEQYLRDYHNRSVNGEMEGLRIVSIEQTSKMRITSEDRYYIIIDKLCCDGGTYFVCDYKTSIDMLTREKAEGDRQLAMYALWVYDTYPDVKKVVQRWHMLHFGKDVDVIHTREELESMKAEVAKQIAIIEQCEEFPTNRTKLCDYCSYQMMCPEFKHLVQVRPLLEQESAKEEGVQLVDRLAEIEGEIRELKKKASQLEESLLKYHEIHGVDAIFGRSAVAKISVRETVRLPEKFSDYLRGLGLLNKYGQVSHSKVKKAVLSGEAEPEVMSSVVREMETKVAIRRRYLEKNVDEDGRMT